jgi:hypothetical protein
MMNRILFGVQVGAHGLVSWPVPPVSMTMGCR